MIMIIIIIAVIVVQVAPIASPYSYTFYNHLNSKKVSFLFQMLNSDKAQLKIS